MSKALRFLAEPSARNETVLQRFLPGRRCAPGPASRGEAAGRPDRESESGLDEQAFWSMFDSHDAVMMLVDPAVGAIANANDAAARFYGYSRQQLGQMNFGQLLALPEDAAQGPVCSYCQDGALIVPHRLASGETRMVEVRSSPCRIGTREFLFSILYDVTDRKRLETQLCEACDQERQRLGRDLHDSLGGHLSGIALLSRGLADALARKRIPEASVCLEIAQAVNDAIAQSRAIARGLCPFGLDRDGLSAGLRDYAANISRFSGVECRCDIAENIAIADEQIATQLYRIAQESVSNAIRHGKARHILIELRRDGPELMLAVRDDGLGIGNVPAAGCGMGLRTMRYRADAIGAKLEVKPVGPTGTRVCCQVPMGDSMAAKPQAPERYGVKARMRQAQPARTPAGAEASWLQVAAHAI